MTGSFTRSQNKGRQDGDVNKRYTTRDIVMFVMEKEDRIVGR